MGVEIAAIIAEEEVDHFWTFGILGDQPPRALVLSLFVFSKTFVSGVVKNTESSSCLNLCVKNTSLLSASSIFTVQPVLF
jgi:hypothetical protein